MWEQGPILAWHMLRVIIRDSKCAVGFKWGNCWMCSWNEYPLGWGLQGKNAGLHVQRVEMDYETQGHSPEKSRLSGVRKWNALWLGSERSCRSDIVPDVWTPGRSHGDEEMMQTRCWIGHHPLARQPKMGERDNCELSVNVLKKHGERLEFQNTASMGFCCCWWQHVLWLV